MFGNNNYFFDLLAADLKKKSKDGFYTIKTQIKDFDVNDFFGKMKSGVKKTATIDGVYSYQIDAPGFTKDSIDINLIDGHLTIKAKNDSRVLDYNLFIDEDTISKVTLELGILDIKVNEVKPKDKSTKINID
jgi:hypothetical protein